MSDTAKEKAEGMASEVSGRVKSAVGSLTGDDAKKAEGEAEQVKGKVQKGAADLKDKVGDLVDKVTGDDKR